MLIPLLISSAFATPEMIPLAAMEEVGHVASELNVPLPVTALSRQLYRTAIAKGLGEDDICGSIRVLEDIAGCEVVAPAKPAAK